MNSVAVSVIIPVYNVENTLDRCLKSVLAQNFKDYEIILVNDGSQDNSGFICDKYAKEYSFIRVIHKDNEGLGPTRNRGVEEAKGKYIYHCDSDDWISPDLLQKCYDAAEKNDANIVVFGYTIFTEEDELKQYQVISAPKAFYRTADEAKTFFVEQFPNSFIVQSACNRFIKRTFLLENDIWFKPFRRCQDVVFSLDLFDRATNVLCIEESYYNYIITPGVYKGRSFDEMLSIYLDVYDYISGSMKKWGVWTEENRARITTLYMSHVANYASYYVINKSKNKRNDIKYLIGLKKVKKLFCEYTGKLSSSYLGLTRNGVKCGSVLLLYIIFLLHERRKGQ